jgi:hypothetical protein
MALEAVEARRGRLGDEPLLELLAREPERDVHPRPAVTLRRAAVELGRVDGVVEQARLLLVDPLHGLEPAEPLDPLGDEPDEVYGKGRRRVVERLLLHVDAVVEHGRQPGRDARDQVFAKDDGRHARRPHVLLGAGVEERVLRDVEGPAEDVGGGVADERDRADLGLRAPLGTEDRVVRRVVDVGGVRVELDLVLARDTGEALRLGRGGNLDAADLLGLLDGGLRPRPCDDVVGRAVGGQEVHRHHRELQRRAALQEQDLVPLGDAEDLA